MFNNKSNFISPALIKAAFVLFSIQCSVSAPVETLFSAFIKDMAQNNCTLPTRIQLPFNSTEATFEAFSSPLLICDKGDYMKYNKEVPMLCNEIFSLLKNISCSTRNTALPEIQVALSTEVCKDFASYSSVLPSGLLKHLSEDFTCNLMCKDEFETSCKVLLWSFLVNSQIKGTQIIETAKDIKSSSVIIKKPDSKLPFENPANEKAQSSQINLEAQMNKVNIDTQMSSKKIADPAPNLGNPSILDSSVQGKNNNPETSLQDDNAQRSIIEAKGGVLKVETKNDKTIQPLNTSSVVEKTKTNEDVKIGSQDAHAGLGEKIQALLHQGSKIPQGKKAVAPNTDSKLSPDSPADGKEESLNANIAGNMSPDLPADGKELSLNANIAGNKSPDLPADGKEESLNTNIAGNKSPDLPAGVKEEALNINIAGNNELKGDSAKSMENPNNVDTINNRAQNNHVESESGKNTVAVPKTNQEVNVSEKKDQMSGVPSTGKEVVISTSAGKDPSSQAVSDAVSEIISNPTVATMVVTPSLEKMEDEIPLPVDKDADQYNDLDNTDGDLDGEYPKQDYNEKIYEPTASKEAISQSPTPVELPKEPVVVQSEDTKRFNELSSSDSFGRSSDEIQVIASFPDQEDSHFFFYFLSIVLVLMAGYLIFHNKQKIIALIVEGRHERRHRSHGLGYKKLETK